MRHFRGMWHFRGMSLFRVWRRLYCTDGANFAEKTQQFGISLRLLGFRALSLGRKAVKALLFSFKMTCNGPGKLSKAVLCWVNWTHIARKMSESW